MNYYQILEVEKNASDKEIRDSYKTLIKKYHPDIYTGNKEFAEKITAELNEAYKVLSSPEKRAEYDLSLLPPTPSQNNSNIDPNIEKKYEYYQKVYENTYTAQEEAEEQENWNQKFKKKLYTFVDEHTQSLSYKSKVFIVFSIIFVALLITLISLNDYIKFINVYNTKTENTLENEFPYNEIVYPENVLNIQN